MGAGETFRFPQTLSAGPLRGPFGKSATFSCALNEGTVEDPREGTVDIPAHIYRALEKAEDGVEEYIASVEEWLARNPK